MSAPANGQMAGKQARKGETSLRRGPRLRVGSIRPHQHTSKRIAQTFLKHQRYKFSAELRSQQLQQCAAAGRADHPGKISTSTNFIRKDERHRLRTSIIL
jgi:hypothetical protein